MKYREIREQVIEASLKAQKLGLIRGTSGNISVRCEVSGLIAISPTSIPYEDLTPELVPLVDLDGNVVDGTTKPSSECPMHTAVMRNRKDVNAVVHTHSKFSTILSIIGQELPLITIPLLGYAPTPAPIVPFEIPGSAALAEAVVKGLGEKGSAVLMENHGMLAVGSTIDKAMTCTEYIEEGAEITFYCRLAGKVKGIDPQVLAEMIAILKSGRAL